KHRWMKLQVACIRPRNRQKTIDQASQMVDLFQHAANALSVFLPSPVLSEPNFTDASNGRQRCAQFVGYVRSEAAHLIEGQFETSERVVKCECKFADFTRAADLQPFMQSLRTDLLGADGHFFERC